VRVVRASFIGRSLRWNLSRTAALLAPQHRELEDAEEAPAAMYSVFYIIGVVVVVLAILSLLGLN
jgi:hypothetical protein